MMTVTDIMILGMHATACIDPEVVHVNLYGEIGTYGTIVNSTDVNETTAASEKKSPDATIHTRVRLVSSPV